MVCLSNDVKKEMVNKGSPSNVTTFQMGIGSIATFHGYPDCNIRATKSAVTCLGPSSPPSSDPVSTA